MPEEQKPSLFDQISKQRLDEMISRLNPEEAAELLLSQIRRPRERDVLIQREALFGNSRKTLEEIGKELAVTRERIRQIEKSAWGRLRTPRAVDTISREREVVNALMRAHAGLLHEEQLLEKLLPTRNTPRQKQAMRFLLRLVPEIEHIDIAERIGPAWKNIGHSVDSLHRALDEVIGVLQKEGKPSSAEHLWDTFKQTDSFTEEQANWDLTLFTQLLSVSRQIMRTEEGTYGLRSWREINPRSIRDKTLIVLRRHGAPMHFSNIAEAIKEAQFDNRSVTKQAVHNELIRDPRFVLIGRGIYGLSEWGHKPGTVSEVIARVLEQAGQPLHKDEIIEGVLRERQVKPTTIILNLQEKPQFVRVKKATYVYKPEAVKPKARKKPQRAKVQK
jgi:DNA-directed RNA polymerase delta subunit